MKSFWILSLTLALAACGGGGGGSSASNAPVTNTLGGVAAVGAPISNATIKIICAAGSPMAQTTTNGSGVWSATLSGQTLPCAVQVSGGTINSVANVTLYHAIAAAYGNLNITPLTDLIVANIMASATPNIWFSTLSGAQSAIAGISQTQIDAALARLKVAMPSLASLNTINPFTTVFVPASGNLYDDTLSALKVAIANSGVSYASLLTNASAAGFTTPSAGFNVALAVAYSGLSTTPPSNPAHSWTAGNAIYATGAISTYTPAVSSLANGKVMAVFAQSEASGTKVYATMGEYASALWATPVVLTGSIGSIVGVNNSGGWNQPSTSTVVVGDPTTGNALAAWTSQVSPETSYRVWLSSYNINSGNWTAATQIGTALQPGLKTANSASGGMAIGWVASSAANAGKSALAVYLSNAGVVTTDALELGTTVASGWKIGLSGTGAVVAAWSGASQQVLLARRGTASWVSPIVAGTGAPAEDANLSLAVGADGSVAALWRGIDPSIHTAVYDASNVLKSAAILNVGSVDNTRPSVAALSNGKFAAIFAESSISTGSVLYYDLASCNFDPATGWSTPVILNTPGDVGSTQLAAGNDGLLVAIVHGYNEHAYQLSSTGGLLSSYMHYNGYVPAFALDAVSGKAVMLWTNATQLMGDFYH